MSNITPIPGRVDYHIHYHLDSCASSDMTFENIYKKAEELDLTEIAVLKHYSYWLPNGKDSWVFWKRIKDEDFKKFIDEYSNFMSSGDKDIGVKIGVETELVNQKGDINIPTEDQGKIDIAQLSMHFMPLLDILPYTVTIYPPHIRDFEKDMYQEYLNTISVIKAEDFVSAIVEGLTKAIMRYPKVRSLSHFYDGLYMLRAYKIPVDEIPEDKLLDIMDPLFKTMLQYDVRWELTEGMEGRLCTVRRANDMGIKFIGTVDAHRINSGSCAKFVNHYNTEKQIDDMGLTKGVMNFDII